MKEKLTQGLPVVWLVLAAVIVSVGSLFIALSLSFYVCHLPYCLQPSVFVFGVRKSALSREMSTLT